MLGQSFGAWATSTPRGLVDSYGPEQSLSLAKMLPKPQYDTPPSTPPDAPDGTETAVVQACVRTRKGIVLRADVAKDSARVGSAAEGDALAVIELKRTASGTVRARTPAGWTTATTSAGKRLLATAEGVSEGELDGGGVLPLLSCSPRAVSINEPSPPPRQEQQPERAEPMSDLPDLPLDALTPPASDAFSRVYGPAVSPFLAEAGPVWSKKRCPDGPLGRGSLKPLKFISTKLLPMLAETFTFESSYKWIYDVEDGVDVRRTTMVLQLEHTDGSLSKLMCCATEPAAVKKARGGSRSAGTAHVEWELWRRAAPPASTAHERKLASATYGGAIVKFCAENLGTRVGDGECWSLAERSLVHAGAARPLGYSFGDEVGADEARAGDIVQFESARFEWVGMDGRQRWCTAGAAAEEEGCVHHTAVLEDVATRTRLALPELVPPSAAGASADDSGSDRSCRRGATATQEDDGLNLVLHVYQQNPKAVHRSVYRMEDLVSGSVKFFRPRRPAKRVMWPPHDLNLRRY